MLTDAVAKIREGDKGPAWGAVHRSLVKLGANPGTVTKMIGRRSVEMLDAYVAAVEQGADLKSFDPEAAAPAAPAAPEVEVDPETQKQALRAFRKRLKFMRLDEESKLGVGPMSGGRKSEISVIMPPSEYPSEVWQALVRAGKLRDMKQGFYELTDE